MPGNVLSRDDLEATSARYEAIYREDYGPAGKAEGHVFCALYALGLLGVLREDQNSPGRFYQDFPAVGQFPLGKVHVLPMSDYYFLHPAFSDFIIARDATFVARLHRFNVVGPGKVWREPTDYVFVAVGDISHYRAEVMNRPGPSQAFTQFWETSFRLASRDLQHKQTSNGDSFVLADTNPAKVVTACRSLASQLRNSEFGLALRVGGHSGFWRLQAVKNGEPAISEIVGIAARIEPHAEPGTLFVSEQFFKGVEALQNNALIEAFSPFSHGNGEDGAGAITISKPHEAAEVVRLYRTSLS
jgi:hypothetical protein